MPEIPSFLLADMVSNYSSSGRNPAELFECAGAAAIASHPLGKGAHTLFMSEADLAHFCRNNNISFSNAPNSNSNDLLFGGGGSVNVKSPRLQHLMATADSISTNRAAHLDSRFYNSSKSDLQQQQQSVAARRLAPTQITADKIFPLTNNDLSRLPPQTPTVSIFWHVTFDTLHLKKSVAPAEFQKTPRAPKPLQTLTQEAKPQNNNSESFTYFQSAESTSITDLNDDDNSTNKKERVKIPPPPESSLEHRLSQRQKQIDIGKNTPEYYNYRRLVPK